MVLQNIKPTHDPDYLETTATFPGSKDIISNAKNGALHGHLESTTPKLEDISNQDQILQRSLQPSTVVHRGFNLILFN